MTSTIAAKTARDRESQDQAYGGPASGCRTRAPETDQTGGFCAIRAVGRCGRRRQRRRRWLTSAINRALALLGEPGIGKSTALKAEADRLAAEPAEANVVSIHVDLRAYSSDVYLDQKVFESAQVHGLEKRHFATLPPS